MKRSTFSEEQILYAIRQAEAGTSIGDLCRQLGVSDVTFYTWKKKYAHLGAPASHRLAGESETSAPVVPCSKDCSSACGSGGEHLMALHRGPPPAPVGPTERGRMDCVHDTLADGRPFRILTVVDHGSRQSPVLEAGVRMWGETVSRALDGVLAKDRDHDRSWWIMGRNANHGRSRIEPIVGACRSTSFDPANRWETSSVSR